MCFQPHRGISRVALALELVAAQAEDAAQARQEAALSAAKLRRASRDGANNVEDLTAVASPMVDLDQAHQGRPPTPAAARYTTSASLQGTTRAYNSRVKDARVR